MTTWDTTPSFMQFFLHKAGKALDRRARVRSASEHVPALFQAIVRLLLHIVGFACLTIAGFAFSFIAGMVVAGICCFVMAWLSTNDRGTE